MNTRTCTHTQVNLVSSCACDVYIIHGIDMCKCMYE